MSTKYNVPYCDLSPINQQVKSEIFQKFREVYDKGTFILGNEVEKFEKEFAEICGVKYCVSVGNGLDALRLILYSLGITQGDEVIVPANTFIATALAVSEVGATPIFVDCDVKTYTVDAEKIEEKITEKTKAIIPVHLYGLMANMKSIIAIAQKHGLYVVEDAAQAHLASIKNVGNAGQLGIASAFSFYPGKNLGALGDGGAVTTNSKEIYKKILKLRNYGSTIKYHHELKGVNSRLDEVQAGFLRVKLKYLKEWTVQRKKIASWYFKYLPKQVILPFVPKDYEHVWHIFCVRISNREKVREELDKVGIKTLIHYPVPIFMQKAYEEFVHEENYLSTAKTLSEEILSLPIWVGMEEDIVKFVCDEIRRIIT